MTNNAGSREQIEALVLQWKSSNPSRGTRWLAKVVGISRNRVTRILRKNGLHSPDFWKYHPAHVDEDLTKISTQYMAGVDPASGPDFTVEYVVPEINRETFYSFDIFVPNPANRPRMHCIIPDAQQKDGVPNDHLRWVGNFIEEKRPDVVINIGDFADMPSLSSYSLGKAEAEGSRYVFDIRAAQEAMAALMRPIQRAQNYKPQLVLTLGNHENRIDREAEANPRFEGKISTDDLEYEKWGWQVYPFLDVVKIDGWEYSHYFTSGAMGRPVSSAAALLRERQCSAVQGHVQYTDMAIHKKTGNIAIFCGICYLHNEKYLTPQGNSTRRQIIMLHEVHDGYADPMFVSLAFLKSKYS
jgi:hypothetical protein